MSDKMWLEPAQKMLREGYGVEDIAVTLDVPVELVRMAVRAMRSQGFIRRMFPRWSK